MADEIYPLASAAKKKPEEIGHKVLSFLFFVHHIIRVRSMYCAYLHSHHFTQRLAFVVVPLTALLTEISTISIYRQNVLHMPL